MSSKTTTTENLDAKTTTETTSSDRKLIISRIIDAPRERVLRRGPIPNSSSSGSRLCPIRHRSRNLTSGRAAPT